MKKILATILMVLVLTATVFADVSFQKGQKVLNTRTSICSNPTANPTVYNMDKLYIILPNARIDKNNFNQMLGAAGNKTAARMGMMDKSRESKLKSSLARIYHK
jgi:hypothetical protein